MICKLKSIKKIEHASKRYDIEVADNHNFVANNIIVHNSLGIIFKYDGEVIFATRGSFTSDQAIKAKQIYLEKYNKETIHPDYTYLVEIIYPANRIVINYNGEEKLVLLAMIKTNTGEELPYEKLNKVTCQFSIVGKYNGLKDFKEIQALNLENKEGFVIRFESGYRMKVKFVDYCRLHRIVTGVSSRTIWEYLKAGKSIEELTDNVPDEFYGFVKATTADLKNQFDRILTDVDIAYRDITNNITRVMTQKQFAIEVFAKYKDISGLLFLRREQKDLTDTIWKRLRPVASIQHPY